MVETPDSPDVDGQSGAAIEEEIGNLSSQLERQPPPAAAPQVRQPKNARRILDSPWLAGVLIVVVAALTAFNIFGIGFFGGDRSVLDPPPDQLRATMLFAFEEIEAYREDDGRLPRDLEDIGLSADLGLTYTVMGADEYELTATDGEKSLSLTSNQDPKAFFGELWIEP